MSTLQKDRILQLRGETLYDRDGDKIGTVDEIYLDADTGQPEWALVSTGLFGGKSTFVPVAEATEADGDLRVPFDKATVKDAPKMDPDGQLSHSEETELYRHYGRDYGDTGADTDTAGSGLRDRETGTTGYDTSGPTTDDAMTRSEEELKVGTTEREAGRARLRKYVVTDEVTKTVPVKREEVRLEREPITDANVGDALAGPAISEEEHEVVLTEERPVVEKEAVPVERVRLDKETVTEQQTVTEQVREERIDTEGDGTRR
jgi:uncharacterized protein (TIGR02271 family)